MNDELRKVQIKQLELAIEVKRICDKYNIKIIDFFCKTGILI